MIVESSPVYSAAKGGLGAQYNLNFGSDVQHIIQLNGTFQGDPVLAKTLYVNNYSSAYAITIVSGSFSTVVPAFSTGYVDIRGFFTVELDAESTSAGTIPVSVLDFVVPPRVDTRTFQAASLTNDPYWSNVCFASHCEGFTGATTVFEERSKTSTAVIAVTNTTFKFGNASAKFNASLNLGAVIPCTSPYSIDFFGIPVNLNAWLNARLPLMNVIDAATTNGFNLDIDGAGNITNVFYTNSSNGFTSNNPVSPAIPLTTWCYFALCATGDAFNVDSGVFYINGTPIITVTGQMNNISHPNKTQLQFNPQWWMDEVRVTAYPRFISSAPVPTSQFLNQ